MYAPLPSALMPARVLFLARSESSVRTDTKTLRGLGVSDFLHVADSATALARLGEEHKRRAAEAAKEGKKGGVNGFDLVICDEQLGDVPAQAFLYQLAGIPGLNAQPVLVLASSRDSAAALRATGVYVMERPYTPADLKRMMQKALSPLRRRLHRPAFEAAAQKGKLSLETREDRAAARAARPRTAPPTTTSDLYQRGLAHLKNNDARAAEHAFVRVLERQEDHVGAALGLARICRAREDVKSMRHYLLRAAAASLRLGDKVRAAAIAAMLPPGMRENIFANEAAAHMEVGAYRPAALSFLEAGGERPEIPLHRQISRACLMTPQPEESMKRLCGAFEGLGHKTTAAFLRRRLLSYQPFSAGDRASWLDKYPRLKEAVSVAAFTAWAWKQA